MSLAAYLEIREALELKAFDLAKSHLGHSRLEKMLAGNQVTAEGEPPQLDNRLHQYLIEKSRNRYIQSFFRQILEALIAKHWAKARKALSDHIWAQRPILRSLLDIAPSGD